MGDTYTETRRAIDDARDARLRQAPTPWPDWTKTVMTVLSVGSLLVALTLAYAALDKRISLIDQKLDYLVQQVHPR